MSDRRRDRTRSRERRRGGEDRDDRRGGDDRDDRRGGDRDRRRDDDRRDDRDKPRDDDRREEKKEKKVEDDKNDDVYRVGRQVIVKGLQKNPEKNGSLGTLVEFNAEKSRWVVALASGNNNFKEDNLELMPDNSDVVDDKEEPPTAKIYITHLAAETTEKDLLELFAGCGVVAKEAPKDVRNKGFADQWPYAVKVYKPGRADGDGCLTYMDAFAAKAAIKTFNRYKFKGNKIGVAYAGQGRKYEAVELQQPWYMREENQGKLDNEGGGKGGGGKDGGKSGPKPGDWVCADCGADVFASKDSCFKCGAAKPGAGGGGGGGGGGRDDRDSGKGGGKGGDRDGGKGGGKGGDRDGGKGGGKGGKPGDWTCSGCGANVFASKDSCFKCGGAKPSGGGGGGGGSRGGGGW